MHFPASWVSPPPQSTAAAVCYFHTTSPSAIREEVSFGWGEHWTEGDRREVHRHSGTCGQIGLARVVLRGRLQGGQDEGAVPWHGPDRGAQVRAAEPGEAVGALEEVPPQPPHPPWGGTALTSSA